MPPLRQRSRQPIKAITSSAGLRARGAEALGPGIGNPHLLGLGRGWRGSHRHEASGAARRRPGADRLCCLGQVLGALVTSSTGRRVVGGGATSATQGYRCDDDPQTGSWSPSVPPHSRPPAAPAPSRTARAARRRHRRPPPRPTTGPLPDASGLSSRARRPPPRPLPSTAPPAHCFSKVRYQFDAGLGVGAFRPFILEPSPAGELSEATRHWLMLNRAMAACCSPPASRCWPPRTSGAGALSVLSMPRSRLAVGASALQLLSAGDGKPAVIDALDARIASIEVQSARYGASVAARTRVPRSEPRPVETGISARRLRAAGRGSAVAANPAARPARSSRSEATIRPISCSKDSVGFQPSSRRARRGSPMGGTCSGARMKVGWVRTQ